MLPSHSLNRGRRDRNRAALIKLLICFGLFTTALDLFGSNPDIIWTTNSTSNQLLAVAVSQDGAFIASGAFGQLNLWRADGALVKRTLFQNEDVKTLSFSPDGTYLVSGGSGHNYDMLRFWRPSDGNLTGADSLDSLASLAVSADSQWLALLSRNSLALRTISGSNGGSTVDPPPGNGTCVTFSPTAKIVVTGGGDGSVTLWDYTNQLSDQTILATYSGQSGPISSVAFLPGGSRLGSSSEDGTIAIRRISDGVIERTIHNFAPVRSVAIAPDGKTLLSRGDLIKYWRVSDGALLLTYDDDPFQVASLAISPTGKFFVYGKYNGTLVVARMPLWIEQITRNGNEVTLRWQGGSGLYQLQARNDLSTGQWQNVGNSTTNTTVTHSCLSPIFFRIQSLPNP